MRRPFELEVAVVGGHLVVLPADLLADLLRRNDQIGAHGQSRDLHLASEVEVEHQAKGFGDAATDREQPVIAQDEPAVGAEVANDALALIEIERDPLVIVNAEAPVILERDLADRQERVLHRGSRHASPRVGVDDAGRVMTRQVNGAVDGEAGGIPAMRAVVDLAAVHVDLHQR